jgi:uncharacterized protein involved in exopolysaccharide biosynthesis
MLNILEAFFRRPWLHLLPLILMVGLGAASVLGNTAQYRSTGTLLVSESLIAEITNASTTPGLTFESPATVTARQINELLRNNLFLTEVVEEAELDDFVQQGQLILGELRTAVSAAADGDNTVRVSAGTNQPTLSALLAAATIASYKDWAVGQSVSQSESSMELLQQLLDEKQEQAAQAVEELDDFVQEHGNTPPEQYSPADQLELERLQSRVARAEDKIAEAEDNLDTARREAAAAAAIVDQRLTVVDEPVPAAAPEGRLRKAALTVIVFGVLGALLSLASVVVAATLDRTIRVPNDISAKFGLDVLAVIPNVSR